MPIIGVDVGGTKVAAGTVPNDHVIHLEYPSLTKNAVTLTIIDAITQACAGQKATQICIGIPGIIQDAHIVRLPNLSCLEHSDLVERLKRTFKCPVTICNDADAFTVGEWKMGVAKGRKSVLGITLGTGIGGGVIINNKLIPGAGELGHMRVFDPTGKADVESVAGGRGLCEEYHARTQSYITGKELAQSESIAAKSVRLHGSTMLGFALANSIHLIKPDIIVFGGSFTHTDRYVQDAIDVCKKLLIHDSFIPEFAYSKLGEKANIMGAIAIASKK